MFGEDRREMWVVGEDGPGNGRVWGKWRVRERGKGGKEGGDGDAIKSGWTDNFAWEMSVPFPSSSCRRRVRCRGNLHSSSKNNISHLARNPRNTVPKESKIFLLWGDLPFM